MKTTQDSNPILCSSGQDVFQLIASQPPVCIHMTVADKVVNVE